MTRPVVHLPEDLRRQIIDHCLAELPDEGCGLFAMEEDRIVAVYPTGNAQASPSSYTVPPDEHFAALSDAESKGWELGGVFHSHPEGTAEMSMVDVMAALEPEWVYLVVGLRSEPTVRGWVVGGGTVEEIALN